jgi:hypothetical protein
MVCGGSSLSLWDFKNIYHRLRADTLQAIKARRPAYSLQPQTPEVTLLGFGRTIFSCALGIAVHPEEAAESLPPWCSAFRTAARTRAVGSGMSDNEN